MNLDNFHKAFENKVRLGVMSILMVNDEVTFNDLKEILELTDGNLASHLKAIEKEGFIEVKKEFEDRKPKTSYKATEIGRSAFEAHLEVLSQIVNQINQ